MNERSIGGVWITQNREKLLFIGEIHDYYEIMLL